MSIFNHFQNINLSNDQQIALEKLDAFLKSDQQVFILQGYAGSGKTTLLKGIVSYLIAQKKETMVMAPTGRAAQVLRNKIGQGITIHRGIYNFDRIESKKSESTDEAEQSYHYYFPLKHLQNNENIIIIDEASMVSSVEAKHELFTFGTGVLLKDLLTFASLTSSKNKIIFVGDPAQLPPVGDKKSWALEEEIFIKKGFKFYLTEMKEVKRQSNNLILRNALKIREILKSDKKSELQFDYDNESFVKISATEIIEKFTDEFPNPELGNGVIINYSNVQCFHNNVAVRKKIFPQNDKITVGDLLVINNNNYHTYETELFNGDMAKVVYVNPEIIKQSAPVWCDVDGEKIKKTIHFEFRRIKIRLAHHPDEIDCMIIDNHLHRFEKELSVCEMKALYINFVIRFNETQKSNNEKGLKSYKIGSEEFKRALKEDPYFNALQVKFGYAITCHKAQGGEWNQVFIDYAGQVSLKEHPLRWCYTATTRGINKVYALNAPNFSPLQHFKILAIGNIGKAPLDAINFNSIPLSPFHKEHQHKCKSMQYWKVLKNLEETPFEIINVETFNFQERYTMKYNEIEFQIQGFHGGAGIFSSPFIVTSEVLEPKVKSEIENIFNNTVYDNYQFDYTPSKPFLDNLYSQIAAICSELDITITNIKEEKNYVNYYFITDSNCAYIQFYFNQNNQLTTALPKTMNPEKDIKLEKLIQKLNEYAS